MVRKPTTSELKEAANRALHGLPNGLGIPNAAAIQRTIITRPPPIPDPIPEFVQLQEPVLESVSQNTRFITERKYDVPGGISRLRELIDAKSDYMNRWMKLHTPSAFCAYADHRPNKDGGSYEGLYLHLVPIRDSTTVEIAKDTTAYGRFSGTTTVTFLLARGEEGEYLGHLIVNRPDVNIRIHSHELLKETDRVKRRIAGPLPEFCVVEVGHEKVGHEGRAVFLWILRSPDEEQSSDEESEEPIENEKGKTKSPHTGHTGTDPTVPPNPPTVEGEKSAKEPENAPVDAPNTAAPTEPGKQPGDGPKNGPEEQPGNGPANGSEEQPGNGPANEPAKQPGDGPGNEPTDGPESAPGNAPVSEQVNEQPPPLTACEEFRQRLGEWQQLSLMESPKTTAHKFPHNINREQEDLDITLAILSVTESLGEDFARIPAVWINEIVLATSRPTTTLAQSQPFSDQEVVCFCRGLIVVIPF